MGIDFYIDDDKISLPSATWYYEFRNWVAEQEVEHNGDFPHILEHSDINGAYLLDENESPDYAEYTIKQMFEGCEVSVRKKTKITMGDGAWDGE